MPVLLVRHGRTADNAARVLVGRRDVPLDQVGRDQAARLREILVGCAPTLVVSSPLRRALETVDGMGPLRVEPRLMEVDHGRIEGLQEQDFRRRFADFLERWRRDPERCSIPDGESLGDAAARAYPALREAVEATPAPGPLVLCSHQLVIATLLCRCLELPLDRYRDHTCRNTAINVLGWSPDGWSLALHDHLDHLEPAYPSSSASRERRVSPSKR
jgi:broad specificity phosphatase PhoE